MRMTTLALLCILMTACAAGANPAAYDGSGGLLLGTPSDDDVKSGRANYDPSKFASFKVGASTKAQVITALGAPAYWHRKDDGTSELMYQYVEPGFMFQKVVYVFFKFDASKVLTEIDDPDAKKK